MAKKAEESRVFKLWVCPFCGEHFNHWVREEEEKKNFIVCPYCHSEVPITRKKMV